MQFEILTSEYLGSNNGALSCMQRLHEIARRTNREELRSFVCAKRRMQTDASKKLIH